MLVLLVALASTVVSQEDPDAVDAVDIDEPAVDESGAAEAAARAAAEARQAAEQAAANAARKVCATKSFSVI